MGSWWKCQTLFRAKEHVKVKQRMRILYSKDVQYDYFIRDGKE